VIVAACLFLSAVEYLIPKPLPFLRIGLANLPLLVSLVLLRRRDYFLVALARIAGQGFVTGALFSYVFLFSAAGSAASALVMAGAHAALGRRLSLAGIGVLGALASNVVQLLLASALVFGRSAIYIAPPFLAVGTVSGFLLGLLAERFRERSRWFVRSSELAGAAEATE